MPKDRIFVYHDYTMHLNIFLSFQLNAIPNAKLMENVVEKTIAHVRMVLLAHPVKFVCFKYEIIINFFRSFFRV
jgi:hypothetical protein